LSTLASLDGDGTGLFDHSIDTIFFLIYSRHIWDVPYEDASQSEKMAYIARIIYPTALVLVQLSLLCLYFRLLNDVDYRKYRLALITITAWVMLTYTISLFLNILTCM
jgi:hypothetical protein